ncbi:MAG: methyltransferase domain-containing protein [Thermomicrobiales bacterium]
MSGYRAQVAMVCPETHLPLTEVSLAGAEASVAGGGPLRPRPNDTPSPVGPTPRVLVRDDRARAYPILDGIPVLLGPEALVPVDQARVVDLTDPRYDEAYRELEHYNAVAIDEARDVASSHAARYLAPILRLSERDRGAFPEPRSVWLSALHDAAAEWDAFAHFAPLAGKHVMQLGGTGLHAVKFLLAGAAEAWLISPMVGELVLTRALAEYAGVGNRLHCAAGVGEAIPVADETFDAVYTGGCLHHMRTEIALPEIARVLAPGGKFAALDPWRAPLYTLGTKLLGKREEKLIGKREVGVYCRPMTPARVTPLAQHFDDARVILHGTLTRYPLIALWKFGITVPVPIAWYLNAVDDRLCSLIPGLRAKGSSLALLGTKPPRHAEPHPLPCHAEPPPRHADRREESASARDVLRTSQTPNGSQPC